MKTGDHVKIAAALGIAMFLALLPLPYGFYTLLRVATFFGGIYFATQLWERGTRASIWVGLRCAAFQSNLADPPRS